MLDPITCAYTVALEEKVCNHQLACGVVIEHVNRRLQVFRILSGRYRNRRRHFGLRCNLTAAWYNYERPLANTVS